MRSLRRIEQIHFACKPVTTVRYKDHSQTSDVSHNYLNARVDLNLEI